MSKVLPDQKATDVDMLVGQIHSAASDYCKYDSQQRKSCVEKGDIYISIELWDGRTVTAIPIVSCLGYDLNEIQDTILMDGPDIKYAISGSIQCVLAGIKSKFVTETDYNNSQDILLWQLVKSS